MGKTAAILTASIFALSTSGHASALWVSDFELLAEILILAAFGVFWRTLNSEPHTRTNEFLSQAMFVLLSVVAHRTKGSAKLIPGIVLIYLFLYRRDQIRRFLPSVALILLTIVPAFSVISNPVPPFAPFAEDQSQGWKWKPANFETLSTIVAGNFHPIYGTSGPDIAYSILSVLAPALLWAGVGALRCAAVGCGGRGRGRGRRSKAAVQKAVFRKSENYRGQISISSCTFTKSSGWMILENISDQMNFCLDLK